MKYNKALDYTVLALNEMTNGKPVLAARLFAKAAEQSDVKDALRILEASNAQAFTQLQASSKAGLRSRLTAEAEDEIDAPVEPEVEEEDLEGDPLEQVADFEDEEEPAEEVEEESPALAVAKVLASMQRKAK